MPAPLLMVLSPYGPGFWSRVIARLHAKDAVILDGMTDGEDLRLMAARLLVDAPARFDLIGFCMGGHLAFEIVRQAPERIGKIALLGSSPLPDSAAQAQARRVRIAKLEAKSAAMEYPDAAYTEQAAQWLLSRESYHNSDTARSARRILADVPLRVSLRQQRAMLSRPDNRALAEGLQIPVLIAGGADDRVVPAGVLQGLVGSMPTATMHVFRGCGHLSPLERPRELAWILNRWIENEPQLGEIRVANINRTDVVRIIIDTWSEIFDQGGLSETDDFFTLGGDSMLLTIVALQLEEKLGIMIDPDLIYEASTIGGFSDAIVDACN